MSTNRHDTELTLILRRVSAGEQSAIDLLFPLVYDELRGLARYYFAGRQGKETLQPTAAVHEAYVKLISGQTPPWESRAHFFAVAAKAMRQILADNVRAKNSQKRGGDRDRVTLSGLLTPTEERAFDLESLDRALTKLTSLDERQAQVVECRFLVGMSFDEIAHVMGVSTRSVERDWAAAKVWMRRELAEEAA